MQQGRTFRRGCGRAAGAQGHPQGAPLQAELCNGVEFVIGPIRFRQQLSFSTSSGVLSLRHQVERSGTASFAGHEAAGFADADRQICCRRQFSLFCSDYFSGQDGVLQQGRTFRWGCGRAAGAQGHPQGAPLQAELALQRGRTRNRTDPFSSTTIPFYLWRRAEPRRQVQRLRGCVFRQSRGGRVRRRGQADLLSTTVFSVPVRFFLWSGWRFATG